MSLKPVLDPEIKRLVEKRKTRKKGHSSLFQGNSTKIYYSWMNIENENTSNDNAEEPSYKIHVVVCLKFIPN